MNFLFEISNEKRRKNRKKLYFFSTKKPNQFHFLIFSVESFHFPVKWKLFTGFFFSSTFYFCHSICINKNSLLMEEKELLKQRKYIEFYLTCECNKICTHFSLLNFTEFLHYTRFSCKFYMFPFRNGVKWRSEMKVCGLSVDLA